MDEQVSKLFNLLREIVDCCQTRESFQAESYNLTISEARCLYQMLIDDCESTAKLAEKLGIAKSRITRIVDGLVEKNLVIRSEDAKDRRFMLVKFTAKGKEIAENHASFMFKLHKEVFNTIPVDKHEATIKHLEILSTAIKSVRTRLEAGEFTVK